jgi:signal transduction histidine kinase/CheY-like chemotaxis protein
MSFDLSLPEQSLKAALVMSLLSVWVLVGLFAYLNRYTRRRYFTIWTAAWLFYALWLTLCISLQDAPASPLLLMLKQWCIGAAAVFLLWGSSRFLRLRGRQRLFGLFLGFLGVWSYLSAFEVSDPLWMQLPVFELIGWASVLAGSCFWRVRRRRPYLGAGLLATGFSLWGAYLASYPLLERSIEWLSAGFFISAVLQLFIAVSMIVLVLEQARRQVRLAAQRIRAQEEARTRLEAQLRQAEKLSALGRVIAGVAHELNNPLAVINGYLELILARSELTAPTRSDLEKVAHESQRAAKLVSNFLSFARRQPAQRNLTDLSELVRRVVELRRLSLSDTLVSWTLNLAPDLPPVMVDADQIQQVIVNLVNNALHAVQDGASPGVLTLRTRCSGEVVELCVQDNGPGVPASIAPHIFEPFFTTKPVGAGSGLGLSVAHGIVADHQGRLFYAPAPSGGACFVVELPVARFGPLAGQPVVAAAPTAISGAAPPQRVDVLVLDDEQAIAELLGEMLRLLGYRSTVCYNPEEALELLRQHEFAVVLSDFRMPQMDGRKFFHAAAEKRPEMAHRIVFLTGDTVSEDTQAFLDSTGNPYLSKPFHMAKVGETVAQVLGR